MARWLRQLGLFAALMAAASLAAQEPKPASSPAAHSENPEFGPALPPGVAAEWPFDLRFLTGEDGRPVYVPDGVTLREFLEFQSRKRQAGRPPVPFNVTQVAGTGTVEEERLLLTLVIRAQTTDPEWTAIPLNLSEAVLRDPPVYQGPGRSIQTPVSQDTGSTWHVRGAGDHELTLSLVVPLRKQSPGRRVQLSLPPSAASSLKVRIPTGRVSARSAEKTLVSVEREGSASVISAIGLGSRLDLAWQVLPESSPVEATLQVVTSVTATFSEGKTVTLEASQRFQSLDSQGTFDSVRVSLPPQAQLIQVGGPEYQEHRVEPDGGHVVVRLKQPASGPIDLRWTVRAPLAAVGEPFSLTGFEVDRARIQTGYLAVVVNGDFRLAEASDREGLMQRINLGDLPPSLRQSRASAAYQFLGPLELRLTLQPIAPYFTVMPRAWLHFEPRSLELGLTCRVRVLRGSLSGLSFRWPGWKAAGWSVESLEGDEEEEIVLPAVEASADVLRIEFPRPLRGQSDLRLRARRPVSVEGRDVVFTMPVPETGTPPPPAPLTLFSSDNLQVDLQLQSDSGGLTRTDDPAPGGTPPEYSRLRRGEYRWEPGEGALRAELQVRPREIRTATTLTATRSRTAIQLSQQFLYEVSYGSLARARLRVPAALRRGPWRVLDESGSELPVRPSGTEESTVLEVPLDPPQAGRFVLEARSAVPLPSPDGETLHLTLPLFIPDDAEPETTALRWQDDHLAEGAPQGANWSRSPADDGSWIWTRDGAPSAIELTVSAGGNPWQGTQIDRALVHSVLLPDGTLRTRAEYRLTGMVRRLAVTVPEGSRLVGAWWDTRAATITEQDGELPGTQVVLSDESADPGQRLLIVETEARQSLPGRFSGIVEFVAPRLPGALAVSEALWLIQLPPGQFLFSDPEGFLAEYRWARTGLLWSRTPNLSPDQLQRWIGSSADWEAADGAGAQYLFRQAGQSGALRLRTMSLSGIVLIGAGAALVLGLALVNWRYAGHAVAWLALAVVVALLAVWFPTQVLVLLQPGLAALVVAIAAAAIDRRRGRRTLSRSLTVAPASGFHRPASSIARVPAGIGSNEATSARTPLHGPAPSAESSGRLSESGSRR